MDQRTKKINIYPETLVGSVSVGARKDLTGRQWAALQCVLPPQPVVGRRPKWTRRQLLNGVRWRDRVGAPWRDVPERYGHWQSIYQLFRRWQRESVWPWILSVLRAWADRTGFVDWQVSVDSTKRSTGPISTPLERAVTLKRRSNHPVMNQPITAGQRGDSPQMIGVLEAIRVPRPGRGRPRRHPDRVLADKAY